MGRKAVDRVHAKFVRKICKKYPIDMQKMCGKYAKNKGGKNGKKSG